MLVLEGKGSRIIRIKTVSIEYEWTKIPLWWRDEESNNNNNKQWYNKWDREV